MGYATETTLVGMAPGDGISSTTGREGATSGTEGATSTWKYRESGALAAFSAATTGIRLLNRTLQNLRNK